MRLRRKPPKGNVRRVTSIGRNLRGVITNKADHPVQFESFQERVQALLFERDPGIKDYRSQPLTITFAGQDRRDRRYTPDFLVRRCDDTIEIHEVTITERKERIRGREREDEAENIFQKKGWKYKVHTEQTLPQETEITNLLALYTYRLRRYEHQGIAAAIREHLSQATSDSLCRCSIDIAHLLGLPESTVFGGLCHLLWKEEICADLRSFLLIIDCSFNPAVKVWLPGKKGKGNGTADHPQEEGPVPGTPEQD